MRDRKIENKTTLFSISCLLNFRFHYAALILPTFVDRRETFREAVLL